MKSLVLLSFLSALGLNAQISGLVLDPTGARVPGATVIATDADGHRVTTTARADGSYAFTGLSAGRYEVAVRSRGFAVFHADDVNVTGTGAVHVDARLNLGRITENLVVTAQGPRAQLVSQDSGSPKPQRIGGMVMAASLIRQVRPAYPADMKAQGLEAAVVLQAVISKEGVPQSLNAQSPEVNRAFVDAAIEAVRQWRYKPTLLNGEPVEVITTITINFTLSQ
jgi:TonB family protein